MKFAFNPRIRPFARESVLDQLRASVYTAQQLDFQVIEITIDPLMYERGLWATFQREVLSFFVNSPVQFQVNIFPGEDFSEAPSDVTPYPRSIYLRRLVQVVEFFEAYAPMTLYIIHPGRRKHHIDDHLASLYEAFRAILVLYPGLPLAIENGGRESVLHFPDEYLTFLDSFPTLRFVLHTGRAYQSVMWDNEGLGRYVRSLTRFRERLAAIRWTNTNPVTEPDRPLQLSLDRAPDFAIIMRQLGRNPALVHILDTVGGNPAALARERRALYAQVHL
jgi:hypothetical protein